MAPLTGRKTEPGPENSTVTKKEKKEKKEIKKSTAQITLTICLKGLSLRILRKSQDCTKANDNVLTNGLLKEVDANDRRRLRRLNWLA